MHFRKGGGIAHRLLHVVVGMIPEHNVLPQIMIGNLRQTDKVLFLDQTEAVHNIKCLDREPVELLDQRDKFTVGIIVGSHCLRKDIVAQLFQLLNVIVRLLDLAFLEDHTEYIKAVRHAFSKLL